VLAGLGRLAHEVRRRVGPNVVGITGSSGKTGTKDLVAAVLRRAGETVATEASFNNDLGLPLTVLRLTSTTRHLVLEMGARGTGHIARLCEVAEPHVGVVLNVGSAHVGEFGSVDAIADAKSELVRALPSTGVAVLNLDDPRVAAMVTRTRATVLGVSARTAAGAAVTATDISLDEDGRAQFRLRTPDGDAPVQLRTVGAHYVSNALAAAAVGTLAGLAVDEIAAALGEADPVAGGRMQVIHRADGVTIVDDAYNANPESTAAALRALVALGAGRRTWAVLGEMRELGAGADELHAGVGELAARLEVARVVAVGAGARAVHDGVERVAGRTASVALADVPAALGLLRAELRAGDVVLVKSSRDAGLRALAQTLAADVGAAS
jgi:UDP-N-acetylmuramoyl-tripeptide--D-alanyl-D-alanine ligase